MVDARAVVEKRDVSRFIWEDGEQEFDIIRYDDEARKQTIEELLAESRAMLKTS
jgi:hypothetical protein